MISDSHTLAVQQLFVKHQQQLRAFVVALAPDFSAADELMQETFLEVSRKASEFQLDSNFAAWARAIAKFKVLGLTRDKQRAAFRLADDVVEALAAAAPPEEDDARHLAVIDLLRKCLERLAPAARELVRLRYFGEHLPEEMARIRSQSVNAINVTLSRARLALRQCVENGLKNSEASP
jgi:RNA polymerase sigma-70 factor (ECF subfamily)